EPIGAKLALTPSLTVNVPGATPEKVTVPLPATVEMVAVAVMVPDLRVKVKLPFPPVVFLVTTIEPKATLLKLQPLDAPGLTVVTQLVGPMARSEERRAAREGHLGVGQGYWLRKVMVRGSVVGEIEPVVVTVSGAQERVK